MENKTELMASGHLAVLITRYLIYIGEPIMTTSEKALDDMLAKIAIVILTERN